MAKRRKTKEINSFHGQAPSDPEEKYKWAIANGQQISADLFSKKGSSAAPRKGVFPRNSVGSFLHSKGTGSLREIYEYYSRQDIQQAMYKYAEGRRITFLRLFKPQYNRLRSSEDILPLALCTLLAGGKYWPSLHGTISRYGNRNQRICDVVLEIDYKSSWKKCFEMTRPVVDLLRDRGAVFYMKFSGNCSVHIIIPAEALQIRGFPVDHSKFFRCLSDLVKKRLREPRYLDTSFHIPEHFLRLAYSVNENTGLVSLPFNVNDYDHFDPTQAQPKWVKPLRGWWSLPKDASRRMMDFIEYVMRGQIVLSSRSVAIETDIAPPETADRWQVDQKVVRQARQQKRQAAREFLPNEGFYDRMVRLGQDMIDLREFLLLEDKSSKLALRTLKHLHNAGQEFDLAFIAERFDVDEDDLRLLWNWDLKEQAFRYYAQDEIKQAIYDRSEGREIRVGNEEKLFFLQEPADLMPLIVYAHLNDAKTPDEYPAVHFTNSRYERTGEIPISCDLKIEFSTKSEEESVVEAAIPVLSLLAGFRITFFMYFDGERGPNVIIPYEALPEKVRLASIAHDNIHARLAPHLKRSMRMPGAACTLVRDPHALSIIPYSIHPRTGLACVPIEYSELNSFSERDAWLGSVEVNNEWWDIPDDAAVATADLLKQMAPLVF